MERNAFNQLVAWKKNPQHQPLIIQGARQVGKTWLMQEFGRKEYKNTVYINFEDQKDIAPIFEQDYDVNRILDWFSLRYNQTILPHDTLIIFDEIQACPAAITSLKYFCENAPQYHIVAAGSLLGISLHEGISFPVGKVEFLDLYPLNFFEFLVALGQKRYVELLQKKDMDFIRMSHPQLITYLKQYYYVGGMPRVVQDFVDKHDYIHVRTLQEQIIRTYENDFSKHTSKAVANRIKDLWQSIPAQLAKENKKFIYGLVREGARTREYEEALNWLEDSGLIYKVRRITRPHLPIKAYEDRSAFKLYISDIGLLGALSDLSTQTVADENCVFTEFKGALTEQYVLQQLKSNSYRSINYWTSDSGKAEIDFILQLHNQVVPIEVKSSTNLRAKSLQFYIEQYQPQYAVRSSQATYKRTDNLYDIPLYMIGLLDSFLEN
ncbi:MAG: ATP-binding protein [Elusimicrobiaceae bacterium]|nr:ATP-binding protein [Elusimicrobiaceae bacterium]